MGFVLSLMPFCMRVQKPGISVARSLIWICCFATTLLITESVWGGAAYRYQRSVVNGQQIGSIIGDIKMHLTGSGETLLDIARDYGLGFNELRMVHPDIDPWVVPPGRDLKIPLCWVIPPTRFEAIVINLPEMRLYHFFPKMGLVKTYALGIGNVGRQTPVGTFKVVDRQVDPVWEIPAFLRPKYGVSKIPPGPSNPLGKYWLGLSAKGYGIHGTNFPWGVGRLVSNGCIRLYPEDIAGLFKEVEAGTVVEIIYEPVKIGLRDQEIFLEVHPDIYGNIPDLLSYAKKRLEASGLLTDASMELVEQAVNVADGVPVSIGMLAKGGDTASALVSNK